MVTKIRLLGNISHRGWPFHTQYLLSVQFGYKFMYLIVTQGVGLLWYGQGFLIYPSAFPPGSRTGQSSTHTSLSRAYFSQEVSTPSEHGLPYDELDLVTPDNVTLKCYMLRQRKDLLSFNPNTIGLPEDAGQTLTEDEVSRFG